MANGGRPNRPLRPRGGGGGAGGGRRRRVVIDQGGARPSREQRQARQDSQRSREPRPPAPPPTGPVSVESGVSVDLSQALGVPMPEIIKILMGLGQRTATQSLSDEEVELIATEVKRRSRSSTPTRRRSRRSSTRRRRPGAAGRHDHGSHRPRQDYAARRDPQRGSSPPRQAASRSTSAPTRSTSMAARSPSRYAWSRGVTAMRARGAKVTDIAVPSSPPTTA